MSDVQEQKGRVLSSFADAFKTYEFTWSIRLASEMT